MPDEKGMVELAVEQDLAVVAARDSGLATGALAASALTLAREMDADNSATSKSMCAKALMETLAQIRAMAPAQVEEDHVDEIAKRRERRLRPAS